MALFQSSSSSSSSEDEGFVEIIIRRPRIIKQRRFYFDEFDDVDFQKRFRLYKESVIEVLRLIELEISHITEKNNAICPMNQLLLTLRFYATGCHILAAADFAGVSKTSSHRIIHRVTNAIASFWPRYMKFPREPNEIKQEQLNFYRTARFPRVIGVVDCTHVKVQSFGGNNAEVYRNRKQYFSVNVQAVCNTNMEITNIVARWQGSVQDSTIFNNSRLRALFEEGTFGNALLVGDSGYRLRPYFVTPLGNPQTRGQQLYNESLIRTRNIIERVFGVWKRRFPILALGSRFKEADTTTAVIVATAVLHNIARRAGEPVPPDDEELELPAPWEELLQDGDIFIRNDKVDDDSTQNMLINEYFARL